MSKRTLIAAALLGSAMLSSAPSSFAAERTAALNLGLNVSRVWNETNYERGGEPSQRSQGNDLSIDGTYLFLGQHFHVGPYASYRRNYGGAYQNTSIGIGATAKYTVEDLQTTTGTPFFSVSAGLGKSNGTYSESEYKTVQGSVGYEYFLNSFVSLQNAINWSATFDTSKSNFWEVSKNEDETFGRNESLSLSLGLGLYI